jgi:hypothetical protein
MKNLSPLSKQAIQAAQEQNWQQAVELNQQILEEDADNIHALNRLALAYMQQDHPRLARRQLKRVLELDKHNKIAQKNLKKIKNKQTQEVNFSQGAVIEEPGKAKNIELLRVTDAETLQNISVGQNCELDPKSKYISINTSEGDQYLGALPEGISQRLMKLIETGNRYSCFVKTCSEESCVVHVKEKKVSPENQGVPSFPVEETERNNHIDKMVDEYKVRDDIPVEIVSTDDDVEVKERNFTKKSIMN